MDDLIPMNKWAAQTRLGGGGGDTKLRVIGLCGSIWEEMGDEGE